MSTKKILNIAILISLGFLMAGCATGSKDSILPQEGPTMKEVYDGHFSGQGVEHRKDESVEKDNTSQADEGRLEDNNGLITRRRYDENDNQNSNDLSSYTRNAHNEIQQIFPRLKNKTLIMYIFPHLSQRERHPVPGYSTAFTMYKQNEYALPGKTEEGY